MPLTRIVQLWPIPLVFVAGLALLAVPHCAGPSARPSQLSAGSSAWERSLHGWLAARGSQVVAGENAEHLFVPASVLKLVVAAAALHHLGPAHRRTTVVVPAGPVVDGVLEGDLVLRGAADPTWNARFHPGLPQEPLVQLAQQVHRAGVRRITGNVVVDASRFPGPGQSLSHTLVQRALWYGAPCSAAALNENAFPLRMAPGPRVGMPIRLSSDIAFFRLVNRALTIEAGGKGSIELYPGTEEGTLVARGNYPVDEPPYAVKASVPGGSSRRVEPLHGV